MGKLSEIEMFLQHYQQLYYSTIFLNFKVIVQSIIGPDSNFLRNS